LNLPPVIAPEQLFVPVYVPEIAEAVTLFAVPSIEAVQPGNPDIPPAGILIVKVSDVPAMVPDRLPLNPTVPSSVAAVTDPDMDAADCATVHVIVPAPVESDADPEYFPVAFRAVAPGAVGLGRELPQAKKSTVRRTTNV
jgi:hypothetical protein